MIMQLSIVTLAPLPRDSRDLLGDSILYFVMSKVQPRVSGRDWGGGDIFLVSPQVGPRPTTPGTIGQSPGIYRHPVVVEFWPF